MNMTMGVSRLTRRGPNQDNILQTFSLNVTGDINILRFLFPSSEMNKDKNPYVEIFTRHPTPLHHHHLLLNLVTFRLSQRVQTFCVN